MMHLVDATRMAIRQGNWYAGLSLALTLPDICGRIAYPGQGSQKRVETFFDKYLAHHYFAGAPWMRMASMTGGDFYALRCAFLHQGEFELQGQRARNVLAKIELSAPSQGESHNNLCAATTDSSGNAVDGTLQVKVDTFCENVCEAVIAWLAEVEEDSRIQVEISSLGKIIGY